MTEPAARTPARPSAVTGGPDTGVVPAISILIVAFNSAALIGDCIASIGPACTQHDAEILLVDNGDGSTETEVRSKFPQVRIIASRGNIGFAAGNNLLAHEARSDRLLLLNPDMVLMPGALDALMAGSLRHPEAAAWGGVTTFVDGRPDSGNAIAMPSLLEMASVAAGRSRIGSQAVAGLESDVPVEVLIGGFVMFHRDAWNSVDGLDERFFLYCEEVDLFHRLALRGHRFWRIADARAHHAIAHGNNFSPLRLLYRAAGTMEFVRHHWSFLSRWLAFTLTWQGALVRFAAGRLLGRWKPHLRKMSDGYRRVALEPGLWMFGYDPERGLLTKLQPQNSVQPASPAQ